MDQYNREIRKAGQNTIWTRSRQACVTAMEKALLKKLPEQENSKKVKELASEYEQLLFEKLGYSLNAYKLRIRKDVTAMRNPTTDFARMIAEGQMLMEQFVNLKETDLVSSKQKRESALMKEAGLKNSIAKKLSGSINDVKSQNVLVREKWGISESAARIDDSFDVPEE